MTKEQLNLKIKKKFPNENFTIIDYQGMKKPLSVQCNNCKATIQVQRAENFFRRKKGCNNCSETIEWKKQKDNFLLWLQSHPEYELIDDLNKIHKSQSMYDVNVLNAEEYKKIKMFMIIMLKNNVFVNLKAPKSLWIRYKKIFQIFVFFWKNMLIQTLPF